VIRLDDWELEMTLEALAAVAASADVDEPRAAFPQEGVTRRREQAA